MIDLKLTDDGDLEFTEDGDLAIVENEDELAQGVRIILGTRKGENQREPDFGLDRENLIGRNPNLEFGMQDIIDAVMTQEPRITSVNDIEYGLDKEDRILNVTLEISGVIDNSGTEADATTEVDLDGSE